VEILTIIYLRQVLENIYMYREKICTYSAEIFGNNGMKKNKFG
jgi:hypothetical protein